MPTVKDTTPDADSRAIRVNALSAENAALDKKVKTLQAANDKMSRELGNTRARNKDLQRQIKDRDLALKANGPTIVANAEGEQIISLKAQAAVGDALMPAHTVIGRLVPCNGATVAYIIDAVRNGLARARPATPPAPGDKTEPQTDAATTEPKSDDAK